MPERAPRPCTRPGCPNLQPCPDHKAKPPTPQASASELRIGGGSTRHWRALRRQQLLYSPLCEVLGCDEAATAVHHLRARRAGGDDGDANLRSVCHHHHLQASRAERCGQPVPLGWQPARRRWAVG